MKTQKILEVCSYSVESAMLAEACGAHRIELCDNYSEGGTTPSIGAVAYALKNLSIPINVMLRPRGGDFLYSEAEFEIIKEDLKALRSMGVNGVVTGFLTANGEIDLNRTEEIISLAGQMEVTFHRAIDMCANPMQAIRKLADLGIKRILSSGSMANVAEGKEKLAKMVEIARDDIIIMPGCGLKPSNIKEILLHTGATEFHTASKCFLRSKMKYFNPNVSMGAKADIDEYQSVSVDTEKIRDMLSILEMH
ncbi:MAG: copper homeostasis protein CutC [Bacteroidia bacterium]|nr:copper homeostasis protein CutC [Bacteroidia bacterium]